MQVFYCDHFELPLPEGHRFPIDKYRLTRLRVHERIGEHIELRAAPAATWEQLLLAHDVDYVRRMFEGKLSDLEQRRIGFPWSAKMLERSRRSTGATLAAAQVALDESLAVHLSGGTHHAFRDQGQGFCVFNDVAVAACVLLNDQRIARALVVDLDVHQGNGTASIFQDDPRVFTFSMHGDRNFPFRKTNGDLDVALADGTGDEEYLKILTEILEQRLSAADWDLVFYLAGADPFYADRMGRLRLTKAGLRKRDEIVLSHFCKLGIPVVVTMAGGYGPLEDVVDIHAATAEIACEHWIADHRARRNSIGQA
ncbi:MAG: histone deacetylase [bacterium]|nr:histone deacetylase [bacterium]